MGDFLMDLSKINKDHKAIVESLINDEYGLGYTNQQKLQFYQFYAELNKLPKKDWTNQQKIAEIRSKVNGIST